MKAKHIDLVKSNAFLYLAYLLAGNSMILITSELISANTSRLSSHIFKENIGKLCIFPNKPLGTVAFQPYFQKSLKIY